MYCQIYTDLLIFLCLCIIYTQQFCYKKQISEKICKLSNALNANEKMLAGNAVAAAFDAK